MNGEEEYNRICYSRIKMQMKLIFLSKVWHKKKEEEEENSEIYSSLNNCLI